MRRSGLCGPAGDVGRAAGQALAAVHRHLDRCKLAPNTARACRRRARACTAWLAGHASEHPDFLFT